MVLICSSAYCSSSLNVICAFCVGTDTASQQEFTSCLKDTLRGLAKNADNLQVGQIRLDQLLRTGLVWCKHITNRIFPLQSSGLAGDDLVKALEGLGLEEGGDGGGDDGNILPIMQSIMQNLLSKEVLYPSLKEITAKVCIGFTSNHIVFSSTSKCHSWMSPTPHSTRNGWKPTSQALAQRTTSAMSSRPKSWERSVGTLRGRNRTRERKRVRSRASWTWCKR